MSYAAMTRAWENWDYEPWEQEKQPEAGDDERFPTEDEYNDWTPWTTCPNCNNAVMSPRYRTCTCGFTFDEAYPN